MDSTMVIAKLANREDEAPDVLFIQDCCCPLFGYKSPLDPTTAVAECLYSGGFDTKVPTAGPCSFTTGLMDKLSEAYNEERPLAVTELHHQLINYFQSKPPTTVFDPEQKAMVKGDKVIMISDDKITPLHTFLSPAKPPRSIILAPLDPESEDHIETPAQGDSDEFSWPRVLLSVRLQDNRNSKMEDDLKNWILNAPSSVVEFKGFYESFSCLLIVELPVEVWDLLPPCGAVSFIGFTRSPLNELQTLPQHPSYARSWVTSDPTVVQSISEDSELPVEGNRGQQLAPRSKPVTRHDFACPLLAARLIGHPENGLHTTCMMRGLTDMSHVQ
ncbi:hypothetical protein PG985_003268 [Apiospora marii]|uniref:uncharacterized protein n=1 Tax=Apiospora marii TaxID=335849 RepID=UPI00312FF5A6